MAHLARSKKCDLLTIANELNLTVPAGATKVTLIEQITGAGQYEEELIKNLLIGIVNEREESEKSIQLEKEEARQFELKKLELEQATENRELELKKLELELASKNKTDLGAPKSAEVLKLMTKYNNNDEINIYLTLFERQVKRLGVEREQWVTYLLGLLPLEIVGIVSREDEELAGDYDHVKKLLLKRFKLNPEQFRQKFNSHRKDNTASWKDFAFELGSFLEEWLVGLEVLTYEDLKELLIIDQMRRKMPIEIKEHFVDDLPNFTKIAEFAEKLDNYEAARYNIRKGAEMRNETKGRSDQGVGDKKNNTAKNNYVPFKSKCFHCNEFASHKSSQCPRRREGLICYRCKGSGHKADQCNFKKPKDVNTTSNKFSPFDKITKMIEINGTRINALVDSGSDVTMMNRKLYVDLGQPHLNENNIKLTGISGSELSPTGFFEVDISIDNIVINCDVYVLDDLRYDMILGNNCLNKLNFEISDSGLKVSGKRFCKKNCSVNFVTAVPLNTPTIEVATCHTPSITTLTDNQRITLPNGHAISDDSKLGKKANEQITPSIIENEFMAIAESFLVDDKNENKMSHVGNPIPKEGLPLETYHIDFIGPMPSTNKNYKHVFTVVDAFTKFVWFYPTKSTTAKDALDRLKLQQSIFGNPSRIIHDKGPAFTSEEFIHYCESEGIERSPITTGVPRGNGQVEIIHKTFISVISKLAISDPTQWYRHVTDVQRIMNSTVTRSTKFTPFELMVGVKLKGKTDLKIKELLEEENINTFVQERENNRIRAKENILKIQEENKKTYDRKRKKATDYKIGDLVAIRRTQFAGGLKLRAKFFGPYRVVKRKKNDRYEVEKVGNHEGPIHTSSAADCMKPWASE